MNNIVDSKGVGSTIVNIYDDLESSDAEQDEDYDNKFYDDDDQGQGWRPDVADKTTPESK